MKFQKKNIKRFLFLGMVLLTGLLLFACSESEPFPIELIGKWETDLPQYENRYIEINETEIIFGTGEVEPNIFFIKSFKSKPHRKIILWTFACEIKKGESFNLSFIYHSDEDGGRLQMKNNLKLKWYRAEE